MSEIRRTMKNNALAEVEDLDVLLFEGEVRAHRFVISPTSGVSFAGGSVVAKFVNAHQQMVQMDGAVDGTDATVTLGASCYTDPGEFKLTIFLIQDDTTAAIYACRGTVIATSGSEKTGDTEPIVEPGVDVAGKLDAVSADLQKIALSAAKVAQYWDPDYDPDCAKDGTITIGGVTITRKNGVLDINGTFTPSTSHEGIHVRLWPGELQAVIAVDNSQEQNDFLYECYSSFDYRNRYLDDRHLDLARAYMYCPELGGSYTTSIRKNILLRTAIWSASYTPTATEEIMPGYTYNEVYDYFETGRFIYLFIGQGTYNHYRILPTVASDSRP